MNQFEQCVIKSAYKMMHIARIIKRNASPTRLNNSTQKASSDFVGVQGYGRVKPTETNESIY